MRTTVTIDPDVEHLLKKAMRARGQSFKQVLNQALRKGLADVAGNSRKPPFEIQARPMGLRAGLDPAHLNAIADELEVEAHAGLSRRLQEHQEHKEE